MHPSNPSPVPIDLVLASISAGRITKDKIIEVNEKKFRIFDADVAEAVTFRAG